MITINGIKVIRDISGQKFGRLSVIEPVSNGGRHRGIVWKFKCDCGKEVFHISSDVLSHHVKSCGCLQRDFVRELGKLPTRKKSFNGFDNGASFNKLFDQYTRAAKKRNLDFLLTKEEFEDIVLKNCFYCGIEPKQQKIVSTGIYIYNGIDRVDNSKGYTIDNCVPCCKMCNRAKNSESKEEFLFWIKSVYENCHLEKLWARDIISE